MTDSQKNTEKMAALGRMTRGLVHDFNNSLASIMGYAEFLITDLPPESEQHLFASNIRQAGLQMQDLIDQIRAFGYEKGQGKDIPLHIPEEVKSIAERNKEFLGSHQTIECIADIDDAVLSMPAHQFRTLLNNIIRNACEALGRKAGHISIRISAYEPSVVKSSDPSYALFSQILNVEKTDAPLVQIDVIDTGCGMDEPILHLAFEPHFTTKSIEHSRGMGLPIALGILKYLGGALSIASSPDQGTKISFVIPVDRLSYKDTSSITSIRPKNILLVEDRDMVRQAIKTMLDREGHHVIGCADGFSALDILRESPDQFDVLMTDFTMPLFNGKDLIEEIRSDFKDIPIVIVSGDTNHLQNIQNAPSHHRIWTLTKPISNHGMMLVLKEIEIELNR